MPNDKSIARLFMKKGQPTKDEWDVIVERKRALLHPLLDKVTLMKFRDSVAGPDNSGMHCDEKTEFEGTHIHSVSDLDSLQGIFSTELSPGATEYDFHFWCLARSGHWMAIHFSLRNIGGDTYLVKKVTSYKYATAFFLDLRWFDKWEIVATLANQVKRWKHQREDALRIASELERVFDFDDHILTEKVNP